MRTILQIISLAGLLMTIVPPILFFKGNISHIQQNWLMGIGTLLWFISAIFWFGKKAKVIK